MKQIILWIFSNPNQKDVFNGSVWIFLLFLGLYSPAGYAHQISPSSPIYVEVGNTFEITITPSGPGDECSVYAQVETVSGMSIVAGGGEGSGPTVTFQYETLSVGSAVIVVYFEGIGAECTSVVTEFLSVEVIPELGLIYNDDFFVAPNNNASVFSEKWRQIQGGLFFATLDEEVCPLDNTFQLLMGGLHNDTADPVVLHNGEFVLRETDLAIKGRGFDWKFTRSYRSRITYDGPMGHNWELNYNSKLTEINNAVASLISIDSFTPEHSGSYTTIGSVIISDGYSRSDLYGLQTDGSYSPPLGSYSRLIKNGDGTFQLRDRAGNTKTYDTNGFYIRIEDAHGNALIFQRDQNGRLDEVIDTLGRSITYLYDGNNRLVEVRDFTNRSITLEYDSNGDLVSVTSPIVSGTPNGNDFPNGKTTKYTYSFGFSDETLNHDLVTITAPNEVAVIGPARTTVTYALTPGYAKGRATSVNYGGTNSSGIFAGGTMTYDYELLPVQVRAVNDAVNRVTVTDRNGSITKYEHNALGNVVSIQEFTKGLRPGEPVFHETTFEYNIDGERLNTTFPEGNLVENIYDSQLPGTTNYDTDRSKHGNNLSLSVTPGPGQTGDQTQLNPSVTYEPIYNKPRTQTDPRGNDPTYVPPNGGTHSAARYTTTYYFDYQEGSNLAALAVVVGLTTIEVQNLLDQAGVQLNLGDLNGDGITNYIAGDVVKIEYPTVRLLADSNQAALEGGTEQQSFELCSFNQYGQMTSYTDTEGNITTYSYLPENDPNGDGLQLTIGVGTGPYGYLKETITDTESSPSRNSGLNSAPTLISNQFYYDEVGNKTRVIDGRGVETQYVVNQLNQVNQVIRAAAAPVGLEAFSYMINFEFDYNNNLIQKETENRDSNNGSLAGPYVVNTYSYDILDNLVQRSFEENESVQLTMGYRYDGNQNLTKEIAPEGNYHDSIYDERDLLFQKESGSGGPFSGSPSTTTFNYDGNRNLIETVDSEDNNGDSFGESYLFLYDGYDRLVRTVDPSGNTAENIYDPTNNIIEISRNGTIGGPTPINNIGLGNVLLSREFHYYDEKNRPYQRDIELFVATGESTIRTPVLSDGPLGTADDGLVSSRSEYDKKGRKTFEVEDDGDIFRYGYDGADRNIILTDPIGNTREVTYDDNNNTTTLIETDQYFQPYSDLIGLWNSINILVLVNHVNGGGQFLQQFTTINTYDSLNRMVSTGDNLDHINRFYYDSRDNVIKTTDALDILAILPVQKRVNGDGNTIHSFYDGLNRIIRIEKELRIDGVGSEPINTSNPNNPDGLITSVFEYDGNSRVTGMIDDNGNTTHYLYDNLDRLKQEGFADGTQNQFEYDQDHNLVTFIDENGTLIEQTYDALNRLTQRDITPAVGVVGTTMQVFEFDGRHRITFSYDNNYPAVGDDDSAVSYAYDSLGRVIEELQNSHAVSSQWAGDHNRVGLFYPNNREVRIVFDQLDRVASINEGGVEITGFKYIGQERVLERTYKNGVRLSYLNSDGTFIQGYDQVKREIQRRHLNTDNDLLAGFQYGYDREDNKLFEVRLHDSGPQSIGDVYQYDSAYRIISFLRDATSPDSTPIPTQENAYTLDGPGNWADLNLDGNAFSNLINEMNEYDNFKGQPQTHDDNGNLMLDDQFSYQYDFANRLRIVTRRSDSQIIAQYQFDAHGSNDMMRGGGRRISKLITNSGVFNGETSYFYDYIHCIEERTSSGSVQQVVYSGLIDLPMTLDKDTNGDGTIDQTYYYHCDGKSNVSAMTDSLGNLVERYTYDSYGRPSIFDATNSQIPVSQIDNPFLFAARRYDVETNQYYYRARTFAPLSGRFLQRDPLSGWFGSGASGNAYHYVDNSPANWLDPLGLDKVRMSFETESDTSYHLVALNATWGVEQVLGPTDILNKVAAGLKKPIDKKGKCEDCLQFISISGEGAVGYAEFGGAENHQASARYYPRRGMKYSSGVKELLVGLKKYFCDNAYFTFEQCQVGVGKRGKAFMQEIADLTGATVVAALGKVYNQLGIVKVKNGKGWRYVAPTPPPPTPGFVCFVSGTLVWTKTGKVPIEQIKVGDMVLSWNESTKETGYYPVTHLIRGQRTDLFQLTISEDETLECSTNHRFWTGINSWIKAEDLKTGTSLFNMTTKSMSALLGTKKVSNPQSIQVFNIEVDKANTYYVGKNGVLVHNTKLR